MAEASVQHCSPDLKHAMGATGRPAHLPVAVPEQMAQSFHVDLSPVERGKRRRLEGAQAAHDLLDVLHAHGKMEPVEDGLHRAARGRAHQRRQRRVAVADRADRIALPPALTLQRRAQQGMGCPATLRTKATRRVGWPSRSTLPKIASKLRTW